MFTHSCIDTNMYTQENTADVGLSLQDVYCMLSYRHCGLISQIGRARTSNKSATTTWQRRSAMKPTQWRAVCRKKNHWTLPEMEILFTTVCAIVIEPEAFGTYGIPLLIIGHQHTHSHSYTHTQTHTHTHTHKVEPWLSIDMLNNSTNHFTGCLGGHGWYSFHWEVLYVCQVCFSRWHGKNECHCVIGVCSPKPRVMYGSYISVCHTVFENI